MGNSGRHFSYCFDLGDPDLVDLGVVPDFPTCREEAVELAKRNRVEVRILVVGLRIAELRRKGSLLGLFGKGQVPGEWAFKNSTLPGWSAGKSWGRHPPVAGLSRISHRGACAMAPELA
jgi:hypothetical protein